MEKMQLGEYEIPADYIGLILYKPHSRALKNVVAHAVSGFGVFDEVGAPAMPYIAAWGGANEEMWYEYVGPRLAKLLGCRPQDAAKRIRDCLLERRIYKNYEFEEGVRKESMDLQDVEERRNGLRAEGLASGRVEAVYKLLLKDGGIVWLKDVAVVKAFAKDGVNLALGTLTVVSKEMAAEARCEKLLNELQNALEKIKTLNGLLPICAKCKKIRDDEGYWIQVEDYIRKHSKAQFSHGLCPDCAHELYPEVFDGNKKDDEDTCKTRDDVVELINLLKSQ